MTARTRTRRTALATAVVLAAGAAALGMPAAASAAGSKTLPLSSGTFDWSVKRSLWSYVKDAAGGTVTTGDGAAAMSGGTVRFAAVAGSYDPATHAVTAAFKGSVEFRSPAHGLDVTLGDLKVATQGASGTLTVDVTAHGSTTDDVEFATLDLSGVQPRAGADGSTGFDEIQATLTAAGAKAFDGLYTAGTALDSGNLAVKAAAPTTPPTTPAALGGPAVVVGGHLDWGVKDAFRAYVTSPGGKVEPSDGVTATAAGYRFTKATGTWKPAGEKLDVSFGGSVRFTHQGGTYAMDLKLSDLKVHTKGATGTLTADVAGKDMFSGQVMGYNDLTIADLSGVAPYVGSGLLSVLAAEATLTADGVKAFSGFYEKGTALDPVTLAVLVIDLPTTAPTTSGTSGTGTHGAGSAGGTGTHGAGNAGGTGTQLAETGAGVPTGALVGAAGALVLTGAALTVTAARRRA
ncbi:HtaA domain-containing protein [Streptomyces sp. NRRL F-5123]|uniref:HtaA domain-containing protein n=1 Tax=Streptomyces sp. NRRL F-5123 TaxID=1463856 RepID=UPI0004E0DD3B|nr:HtaA domain-containing protein [Streptomyces sp. NRRL F-5123]